MTRAPTIRASVAGTLRRAASRLRLRPSPGAEVVVGYAPRRDGRPDPGEVVWAWVPFEEDPSQGKDRPVLIVGRAGRELVALMLTSQDHDASRAFDEAQGRRWMDIGVGGWDRQRRPSEVRLDRVLRLKAREVRREGAALDRARFDAVAAAARALHGWA